MAKVGENERKFFISIMQNRQKLTEDSYYLESVYFYCRLKYWQLWTSRSPLNQPFLARNGWNGWFWEKIPLSMKQGERSTDHSFYLELVYFYCEWNSSRFQYWPKIQPHTLSRSDVFLQLVEILKTLDLNIILQISHFYLLWLEWLKMRENEKD